MPLKLMYITNDPVAAAAALAAGVDRLFVDMETRHKADRQRGRNTVLNHHTVGDVRRMRRAVDAYAHAELLVRCNPWQADGMSHREVDEVIAAGADAVMLPYFQTAAEVADFLAVTVGRVRTVLLLETPAAVARLDAILSLGGIDEVFIGLNDLSIGYDCRFLFELLADGTVASLCRRIGEAGIPYGFGGVAAMGSGLLPAECIVAEHVRLGSDSVILSRTFGGERCTPSQFSDRVRALRMWERTCREQNAAFFAQNTARVRAIVADVCRRDVPAEGQIPVGCLS